MVALAERREPGLRIYDFDAYSRMAQGKSQSPVATFSQVLGKGIAHRRRQRGLNQQEVSTALSLSQSAYSRIEKGQTAVSVLQLRRIASVLNTTASELLNEVEDVVRRLGHKGVRIVAENESKRGENLLWLAGGALVGAFAGSALSNRKGDDDPE